MSPIAAEIFKIVYLWSMFISAVAIFALIRSKSGNILINRLLSCFLILTLLPLVNGYASLSVFPVPLLLMQIIHKLSWLYGPCVYAFIRVMLKCPIHTKREIFLHVFPFTLLSIAIVIGLYRETMGLALMTFGQIGLYLSLSGILCFRHRGQLIILFREYRSSSLYWFGLVAIGAFALMLFEGIAIYSYLAFGGLPFVVWHAFMSLFVLYTSSVALLYLFSPALLISKDTYIISTSEEPNFIPASSTEVDDDHVQQISAKELTTEAANLLASELRLLMRTEHPYLQNDLKLADLAKSMNVSPHQLSELLNVHMKTSFYDFINHARFEVAKQLLHDPKNSSPILDIGYQSGFNSKNTFNRIFKKLSGKTPGAFRRDFSGSHTELPINFSQISSKTRPNLSNGA